MALSYKMKRFAIVIFVFACVQLLQLGCSHRRNTTLRAIDRANTALAEGDTTHAIEVLESRVAGSEATSDEYVLLGDLHRRNDTIRERMCSQRVLEKGLSKYPDDPDIIAELGKTYYEQTFYGDAQRMFERAHELDPDNCIARYYLGSNAYRKWKRVQLYTEYLPEAVDHLSRVTTCSPENEDAFFKLAFSRYALGDTTFVLKTCEAYRQYHPDDPNPDFILGTIYYEQKKYEASWTHFKIALDALSDDEYYEYRDIGMLLTGDAKKKYDSTGINERATVQRLYWLRQDPDPTTEINERFLEHVYRVYQAEIRYTLESPAIDGRHSERGRALIKFGWPTHMRTTLGGGLTPTDGRMEIWSYYAPPEGFTFHFRDEFLNGNYIIPMDYAYSFSAQSLFNDPPVTEIIPETILIPGVLDVVAFRDSDLATSVYVAFAVDADSLAEALWTWDIDSYIARTTFYDITGRPETRDADTLAAEAIPPRAGPFGQNRCVVRSFELPFDAYLVSFCFEDERGLSQSIHWSETNTVKYLKSSLCLSDILFEAQPAADSPTPVIERFGETLTPNPSRAYRPAEMVETYIEIYNLGLSRLVSNYDVTYSIYAASESSSRWEQIGRGMKWLLRMDSDPDPTLSQTLTRTGSNHTTHERIAIDIDDLDPGDYMISITVLDKTTGERAVSSKAFTKLSTEID